MAYEIVMLFIGLVLLVKFSNFTIKNAVRFSYLTGISKLTVGFVIIAVSTSIPEFVIAILSSLRGEGILSMGNVVGANVSNVALIFGVMALSGFSVRRKNIVDAQKIIIVTTVIALFILILGKIDYAFGIFALILFYLFSKMIVKEGVRAKEKIQGLKTTESIKSLAYLIASIAGVIVSSHIVVSSAISVSSILGIAESAIGATVIAIGTTMPELSVNLAALKSKNIDIAVGDSVGSIMTNITLVAGVAALINPITIGTVTTAALILLVAVNAIFFVLISRGTFRMRESFILLAAYALYLAGIGFVSAL